MNPIITGIISIVSSIFGNITEEQKDKIALELQANQDITDLLKSQAQIDANEASNSNLFVAGWRPYIGWVCGLAFSWEFVLKPIITFIYVLSGHPLPTLPVLDNNTMMTVLMGLLGLGTMRSWEKLNGVQNKH